MKYGSVCSGIEAATVAWHPLGWKPDFFSEIEPFPSAVLKHHYPKIPNHGDMTEYEQWPRTDIDVLVGGTPCQSFSVAGLRKGLADPRGNLMLTFGAIAAQYRPRWLVWENVPGVLSSNSGRDFGTFLGMLGQLGYGFAYRILDAQFFGVAQRRRRVFVIGYLGDWRPPAAVLFERESLSGDNKKMRSSSSENPTEIFSATGAGFWSQGLARLGAHPGRIADVIILQSGKLRIATPLEWERFQGFTDNYTRIPWKNKPAEECPDGHRYKALGNSMAVPVMRWIGERIQTVEVLL